MSKKTPPGVRIRMNRDGSMNIRSYGGVDLRKVIPHLFEHAAAKQDEPAALNAEPGHDR